ncbi:MAG: hypothetical protein J1E00_03830, partial [Oscillospiraceae bacterium]|nr:hypothetical protein [Oscillospiraceae bacterium]
MQQSTNVTRKRHAGSKRIFSLLLVMLLLLSTTAGALSAFAMALTTNADDPDGITFYKLTEWDQLVEKGHYIITYGPLTDGEYAALCSSESSETQYASHQNIAAGKSKMTVSSLSEDYVLTLNEVRSNGTYRFQDSKNYRLKLDSTHVFQFNSPSDMTIAEGATEGTWTIKGGRALVWNGNGFASAGGGSTPGTELVIWTDVAPKNPLPDEDDDNNDGDKVFHKMTSKAELREDAHYIIVVTDDVEDGKCAVLAVPEYEDFTNRYIGPVLLDYSKLPYEPEEGARYVFTLSESSTEGTWYFKTEGASLKLNNGNGVFAPAGSPGSVTVSKSGDGWALATANRSLRWAYGSFMVSTNSATPGSTVEIWTDAEPVSEDACACACGDDCSCATGGSCGDPDCDCGTPEEGEKTTFHKVTKAAELHVGSHYIITYTDGTAYYALRYADDDAAKFAGQEIVYQFGADGADISELLLPSSAAYVLELDNGDSDGTWRFEDADGNRLKLDSTHVFHNSSTGNIQLTMVKGSDGLDTGMWRLQNYTASTGTKGRSLIWTANGFDVTNSNSNVGSAFVIWTDYTLAKCACACEMCKDGCACEPGAGCGDDKCTCGMIPESDVKFTNENGEVIATSKIPATSAPTYADVPAEARAIAKSTETKVFMGWFDADGNEFGSYVITENTTFAPKWVTLAAQPENPDLSEFHKMTNVNEAKKDAHYIIVAVSADGTATTFGYPLSNGFIVDLLKNNGNADTTDNSAWNTYLNGPSVMTMTSAILNNDGTVTVELRLDDTTRLKLGTSSDVLTPMFNENGGKIVLSVNSDGQWAIYNAASRYLRFNSEDGFHVHYKAASCKTEEKTDTLHFEIWTDAVATEQSVEETSAERFVEYLPLGWGAEITNTFRKNNRLVLIYTDTDGNSYALVAGESNAVAIDLSDITLANEKKTSTLLTNSNNAWWMGWWFEEDDAWVNNSLLQQGNKYLTLGDTLFGEGSTNISFVEGEGAYTVKNGDKYLGWDSESKQFTVVADENKAINVRVFGPSHSENPYTFARLTDLSQLQYNNPFMVVIPVVNPDGKHERYAIGYNGKGQWLAPVELNADGTIKVTEDGWYTLFEHGSLNASTKTSWTFDYLRLADDASMNTTLYWRPQNLSSGSNYPLSSKSQTFKARFAYSKDGSSILLRGNATDSWLNLAYTMSDGDLKLLGSSVEEEYATPVEIYTVLLDKKDLVKVEYHYGEEGKADKTIYTQGTLPLDRLEDVIYQGDDYIFIGWTAAYTTSPAANGAQLNASAVQSDATVTYKQLYGPYLDEVQSSNLYGRTGDETNGFQKKAKDMGLVGNGNPETIEMLDLTSDEVKAYLDEDGCLHLFPVYAMRGTDKVVTAVDEKTKQAVVGVSDWKANQDDEFRYQDLERERWLGHVNIEIYKDGADEPWVATPLYFSYHNDCTVDLNIKFVWDDLVEEYLYLNGNDGDYEKALYDFVAHFNHETDFPPYDQVGRFIIDGVYAIQGGSESGLFQHLNWIQSNGGQLDNVKGGTTVKIYVSTKYDVKYYLDGQEIMVDHGPYTTLGTFNAFDADLKALENGASEYQTCYVSKDVRKDLMEYTEDKELTFTGDDEVGTFGKNVYLGFAYDLINKNNKIKIEDAPTAFVPKGRVLISTSWMLKGNSVEAVGLNDEDPACGCKPEGWVDEDGIPVAFDGEYIINGSTYGTENTIYAYQDGEPTYEADSPYTYHLYAVTDLARGGLVVSKTVEGPYNGETFAFTVTLYHEDGTQANEINCSCCAMTFENGVATFSLANGESISINCLPAGLTYKVEEAADGRYTTNSTGASGTIQEDKTSYAAFNNIRKTGSLTVSKKVEGVGADLSKKFTFTITLNQTWINGTFGDMTFANGVATVQLADGESATATGLPTGITYTVEETADNDYNVNSTGATGTITDEKVSVASFTNIRKSGDLTVNKKVEGVGADLNK